MSKSRERTADSCIGRKCAGCGETYLAVVVDDHGLPIRDGCGCRVEVVESRLGDIGRLTDSRRDHVGLDAERARADGGSDR